MVCIYVRIGITLERSIGESFVLNFRKEFVKLEK